MRKLLLQHRAAHTDLVELNDEGLGALLAQQGLGGLAVRAVRLGEDRYWYKVLADHFPTTSTAWRSMSQAQQPTAAIVVRRHTNGIVVDDLLGFSFGRHDLVGSRWGLKEGAYEINGGRFLEG
jgi:hypothetical protein